MQKKRLGEYLSRMEEEAIAMAKVMGEEALSREQEAGG